MLIFLDIKIFREKEPVLETSFKFLDMILGNLNFFKSTNINNLQNFML